jgi:hypothetical protein
MPLAVYVYTNDASENEVIAFQRVEDGVLALLGRFPSAGPTASAVT